MSNKKTEDAVRTCAIPDFQRTISGKWKISILWALSNGTVRFGELNRMIEGITQSTLTKQLRELEQDGMIKRYVYREVPPKVEYSLTEMGESFVPILKQINDWSLQHLV